MNVLDLFSGIGGFSLGLERAGMRTVAFCEIDPFCRRVLAKHWPGVPCYDDVRSLTAERLAADGIAADVICGGFPCQDVSVAQGKARAGLDGEHSGLWSEYARIIRELGPRYVIVENVPGLLSLGIGDVLRDLASLGYDAEWQVISAASVGAPHIRNRLWLVGYPNRDGKPTCTIDDEVAGLPSMAANADSSELRHEPRRRGRSGGTSAPVIADDGSARNVSHTDGTRSSIWQSFCRNDGQKLAASIGSDWWASEPDIRRVVDGLPAEPYRTDRISALGNAVVPQIPEIIGRAIMKLQTQQPISSAEQKL